MRQSLRCATTRRTTPVLKLTPREVTWVDLAGARIPFAPIGRKSFRDARRAALKQLRDATPADREGASRSDEELIADAGDLLSFLLIRDGILAAGVAWEGVLGDDDLPLPVNVATIGLLLEDPIRFEALDTAYVRPWSARDQEGNASAGSPDGTSTKATPATTTADSRAETSRETDASQTRKPGKRAARTSSTHRKPTKAKPSGR